VRGTVVQSGTAGANQFTFGRFAGHKLAAGKYQLTTATLGKPVTVNFTVAP
jgi:hypothetical protein